MNQEIAFFEDIQIRKIIFNGKPMLSAVDCCNALEYAVPREGWRKLKDQYADEFEGNSVVTDSVTVDGKSRQTTFIDLEGMVLLCMFSRQPKAKEFRKWGKGILADEIRGKSVKVPQTYAEALREAARLSEKNEELEKQLIEQEPLVNYSLDHQEKGSLMDFSAVAKEIGYDCGPYKLIGFLCEQKMIMKKHSRFQGINHLHPHWEPSMKYKNKGWFEIHPQKWIHNEQPVQTPKLWITPKGKQAIAELWKKVHGISTKMSVQGR